MLVSYAYIVLDTLFTLQEKDKLISELDVKEQKLQKEKEAKDALFKKISVRLWHLASFKIF